MEELRWWVYGLPEAGERRITPEERARVENWYRPRRRRLRLTWVGLGIFIVTGVVAGPYFTPGTNPR